MTFLKIKLRRRRLKFSNSSIKSLSILRRKNNSSDAWFDCDQTMCRQNVVLFIYGQKYLKEKNKGFSNACEKWVDVWYWLSFCTYTFSSNFMISRLFYLSKSNRYVNVCWNFISACLYLPMNSSKSWLT